MRRRLRRLTQALLFARGYAALRSKPQNDQPRAPSQIAAIVILVFGVGAFSALHLPAVWNDLARKKELSSEYAFLRANLGEMAGAKRILYVTESKYYTDYATAVFMIFSAHLLREHSFNVYSDSGCNIYNKVYDQGRIGCYPSGDRDPISYDVIVAEGGLLPAWARTRFYDISRQRASFDHPDSTQISLEIAKRRPLEGR